MKFYSQGSRWTRLRLPFSRWLRCRWVTTSRPSAVLNKTTSTILAKHSKILIVSISVESPLQLHKIINEKMCSRENRKYYGGILDKPIHLAVRNALLFGILGATLWLPRTLWSYDQREGSGEPPRGFPDAERRSLSVSQHKYWLLKCTHSSPAVCQHRCEALPRSTTSCRAS